MSEPLVSIIMSVTNRLVPLANTLESWSDLDYPNYEFLVFDNGTKLQDLKKLVLGFSGRIKNLSFYEVDHQAVNRIWNMGRDKSKGEYVIISMMDEIVSSKQIIHKMLECPDNIRCSVLTYFLSRQMTDMLPSIDWKHDPRLIETLPGFWDTPTYGTQGNRAMTSAGLLCHITGQSRKNWDYIGWWRTDPRGHLLLEQDLHLRERFLGLEVTTVPGVVCYHQAHPINSTPTNTGTAPGYHYENERQARLIESAPRDEQ